MVIVEFGMVVTRYHCTTKSCPRRSNRSEHSARSRLRTQKPVIYSPRFGFPHLLVAENAGASWGGRKRKLGEVRLDGPRCVGCHLVDHYYQHIFLHRKDLVAASRS